MHFPTTPCYFAIGDENEAPICSYNESAHTKSTHYRLILQHRPSIDLSIQNLPHKVSNAIECATINDSDATF
jgi:hypothetical protein